MAMLTAHDRQILRDLCAKLRQIRQQNARARAESQECWTRPNRLQPGRPAVCTIIDADCWDSEILPDSALACVEAEARELEKSLCHELFMAGNVIDDSDASPIGEPERICRVPKVVSQTDWGLSIQWSERTENRGAWAFKPVIEGPDDLKKLKQPIVSYDRAATERALELRKEAFGDLYDGYEIAEGGIGLPAFHLTGLVVFWRGIDHLMLDLYDNPGMIHDLMAFLTEAHEDLIRQWTEKDLLQLPPTGMYTSEGLTPYEGGKVRPEHVWAWTEAQELTQVSPEQHWEFSMAYEKPLVEHFGLSSYGCCEDLTNKIDHLRRIENLRTIGVTPFANVPKCVDQIGLDYVISWRPHPGYFAGERFHPDQVRAYFRENLETLTGSAFHICLKDIQTCQNEPQRLTWLTAILQEEIDRIWGESTRPAYVGRPAGAVEGPGQ